MTISSKSFLESGMFIFKITKFFVYSFTCVLLMLQLSKFIEIRFLYCFVTE